MLDLGALVGRVLFDDAEFQRGYARVLRQMAELGRAGEQAARGTATLDTSLTAAGKAGTTAAVGIERTTKASTSAAAAEQKAAAAASRHAEAVARVGSIMSVVTTDAQRLQQAQLRVTAAQERYDTVMASGTASTQRLAAAQAGLIGAQRALQRTEEQSAGRMSTLTGSMDAQAASLARVEALMARYAGASTEVQTAALRLAAAQDRVNAVQTAGAATTRQVAAANASLIASQRALVKAEEQSVVATSRWRSGLASVGAMALQLGLFIGGIEIAKKAIEFVMAGKHLTDALNSVQAAAQATDGQMRAVRAQAIALGKDLTVPGATAVDAAMAIDDLVRAGMTLTRAMGSARAALLLAAAANVDTADSARVLGDVLDEFKLSADQATKTAGILAAAGMSSSKGLMGVFEAFTYAGTRARALGLNVLDLAAAVVDLSKAGITADRAGTGMAMMFQRLASESPKGQKALDDLGITAWTSAGRFVGLPKIIDQLHSAQQRMGTGSKQFIKDVSDAFGARAANVVTGFALRGVEGYNTMYKRLSSGDVEKAAALMNRGAGAGFRQLGKEATAAGIAVYQGIEAPLSTAVMWIGTNLPRAVSQAQSILSPFEHFVGGALSAAWGLFVDGAKLAGAVLGPVVRIIDDLRTPLGMIGTLALGAYLGFKLFAAVPVILETVALKLMYARDAVVGFGASSMATARSFVTSSTAIGVAANAAGDEVAAGGAVARVGWVGLLGPLGAAAVGIGLLVTMFHHSSSASKEAASAAKAYTDAFASGSGTTAEVLGTIAQQLRDNNVPQKVADLNKQLASPIGAEGLAALSKQFGATKINAVDFIAAVEQGGKPLDALKAKLQAIVDAGMPKGTAGARGSTGSFLDKNGVAEAKALLGDLTAQYDGLSKAQIKEIADAQAFGQAVTPIQNVEKATKLASSTAVKYAQMMGFAVTKNNDVIGSSQAVNAAVRTVASAYNNATQSGDAFLAAQQAFSQSAGTAADRAALIGATLKAANGDALSFAAALSGTTSAVDALTGAFASERQQLAQQSTDAQKAADRIGAAHRSAASASDRVAAAQARLSAVRANSKSTAAQIASAERAVTSAQRSSANAADRLGQAQTAAGKAGALAYADTERAAIHFRDTQKGLVASIDTTAKGSGNLVSQLQAMQDAAVKAAGAIFQHEKGQKGATKAADDAYNLYVTKTKGALIDQAKQLGLTIPQAAALAKAYFGMPKQVKTLIEAEGTNPVVKVLDKIGKLLAAFTGQPWNITVDANTTGALRKLNTLHQVIQRGGGFVVTGSGKHGLASGGPVTGSTPKGVDAQPLIGAVGEWMIRAGAVDKLTSTYGSGIMPMINRGQLPTVAVRDNRPATHVDSSRSIVVQNQHLHAHYPEPERAGSAFPRLMRMAADSLDSL